MPLVKPITKHGNSAGIILEQTILKLLGWEVGTEVEIQVTDDSIVLTRHLTHGRRTTDILSEKIDPDRNYHDPVEKFHFGGGVAGGLMTAHLIQPQNPELGRLLYDAAANALGFRNLTGAATAKPHRTRHGQGDGRRRGVHASKGGRRTSIGAQVLWRASGAVRLVLQQQRRIPARAGERHADGR